MTGNKQTVNNKKRRRRTTKRRRRSRRQGITSTPLKEEFQTYAISNI
jgi:hypothetical protein